MGGPYATELMLDKVGLATGDLERLRGREAKMELVGRAALAGGAFGFAAGAIARLAMRLLFLLNPGTRGVIVGESFPVGSFTVQGTGLILFMGLVFGGLAGVVYGLVRPALPLQSLLSGLMFGGWLVLTLLGLLIIGEDRDFNLFGPFALAAGMFGIVFVTFSVGLGYAVDRSASALSLKPQSTGRRIVTWVILGSTALPGTVILLQETASRT